MAYGPATPNTPIARLPLLDETALATRPGTPDPPTVAGIDVPGAPPIVHAESAARPIVVAGDGDGLVDAAAAAFLDSGAPVLYSAALTPEQLEQALTDGADLVVTDSNRKRARRWGSVQENVGLTERAGEVPLVDDPTDNRLDVFPGRVTTARPSPSSAVCGRSRRPPTGTPSPTHRKTVRRTPSTTML